MFKLRLVRFFQPFGFLVFWIGIALMLGGNWHYVLVALPGIMVRGFVSWWDGGESPGTTRWQSISMHAVLGGLVALVAGFLPDDGPMYVISLMFLLVVGAWLSVRSAYLFLKTIVLGNRFVYD